MSVSENVKGRVKNPKLGKFSSKYPLLVERAREWGFDIPSDAPFADRIIVWRLPPFEKTEGGIFMPDSFQDTNVFGVLVAAGMQALDTLESNGVTLGHIVKFERFAGWEHEDNLPVDRRTPEKLRGARFLHLNSRNILTSVDLKNDLEAGRVNYLRGVDGKSRLERKALPASDKRAKVLKLAADPAATPAERKTARRIAEKLKNQGDPNATA